MERGDIGVFATLGQSCVFEGLLASPPASVGRRIRERFRTQINDWDSALKLWKPHDLPIRSISDHINRLGISTHVVTFLAPEAAEPIYRWLLRKGISTSVTYYPTPAEYRSDLKYDMGIKTVYVPDTEMAAVLGIKATVVSPDVPWSL